MGELKKLEVTAYEDPKFATATGKSFSMQINPMDYNQKKGIKYSKDEPIDGGNMPTYQGYDDDSLKFVFTLDTTGVIARSKDKVLSDMVKEVEDTVYTYVGDAHEPPYLKVTWGTLIYNGRLKSLDVKYTLFTSDGQPIRAKLTMELLQYIDESTQALLKNKSSPDLSHLITVKAGDTLPLLCQRIYKDTAYCTEVARLNGLTGFRYLEPGTQLLFPPLDNH